MDDVSPDKEQKGLFTTLQEIAAGLQQFQDLPILLTDEESWTCNELAEYARRLANGLLESDATEGARIGFLADNRPEWIAACLGAIQAGMVVVPLDVQYGREILREIFEEAEVQILFTTARQAERIRELPVRNVLLDGPSEDERHWRRLLGEDEPPRLRAQPNDDAVVFYTSGTTGRPKGVPLTHRNLMFSVNHLRRSNLVREEDRFLLPLPLHHVYPFVVGMLLPLSGANPIILPTSLTGPHLLRSLRKGRAAILLGVPRLYTSFYEGILTQVGGGSRIGTAAFRSLLNLSIRCVRSWNLSIGRWLFFPMHRRIGPGLRILASGGSALDEDLAWTLEGLGWRVATGYGLTETAPLLTFNMPRNKNPGSAGRPLADVELRIDRSGISEHEPDSGEGEILARGPNVFGGYLHRPSETGSAFTEDGWFRTGDLGYFDENGFLFVTGRASTLIVTPGGEKVQPEDMEHLYSEHPLISEIGILQKDGRLTAVVVPDKQQVRSQDIDNEEEAIRNAIRTQAGQLPSYQHLEDFALTRETLPKTRLGKLRRHLLVERYEQARREMTETESPARPVRIEEMGEADRRLLEEPTARRVWEMMSERYSDHRLNLDTDLRLELGIDSMDWLNLALEIRQRTGVDLEEAVIARIETVRDLLEETARAAGKTTDVESLQPLEEPEKYLGSAQRSKLKALSHMESIQARLLFHLNRGLMRSLFRLRVRGFDRKFQKGQFVFTPNHLSYLDPFALAAAFGYPELRRTRWGGWTGAAFSNPLFRHISRLAQAVPVDPDRAAFSSLAYAALILRRGENLIWFPEGMRSPDGRLHSFRPGIGMVLSKMPVEVVPVWIRGSDRAMPPGRLLIRPHPITVTFGDPVASKTLLKEGHGDEPHQRIVQALYQILSQSGR